MTSNSKEQSHGAARGGTGDDERYTVPGPACSPCVALHVEETQVARFAAQARSLRVAGGSVIVTAVHLPLIYTRFVSDVAETAAARGNGALRDAVEKHMGSGRIAAHRIYQLDASCADASWIPHAAPMQTLKRSGTVLRVVAFPAVLQQRMAELLQTHGFQLHPTQHTAELHVVMQPQLSPLFHFGVVRVASRSHATVPKALPPEAALAVARAAPETAAQAPCRAYFKMQESLRHLRVQDGDHALDIGASPGGWTECLVAHGANVVAVDPGELLIPLANRPIVHVRKLLETALPELQHLPRFSICVCDINARVAHATRLIRQVAPLLEPGARVACTLKLNKKPTSATVRRALQDATSALGDAFQHLRLEWLHANTRNERTLFAVRTSTAK